MIKVSVIIPVYNGRKYIGECLNSVLSQTLNEIEIICVDDGSTDGSYDILRSYSKRCTNIVVLHQENRGAGSARNRGLECAQGKYVCFIDSDDYYPQDYALEHLYKEAEENHVVICGGNIFFIWEKDGIKSKSNCFSKKQMVQFKEYGDFYNFQSYMINRKFIMENKIRFPLYRRYEDPPFFLKAMIYAQQFWVIEEEIYAYRQWDKEVNWSFDIILDMLKGIRDCFKIARENDLIKSYNKRLKMELYGHWEIIYPYKNYKQVWKLINEINRISLEWTGEYSSDILQDRKSLELYVMKLKAKRDHMILQCRNAEDIVIYGAGEVGQYFLQHYGKECKHIVGFAVSSKDKKDLIAGYEVKEIEQYDRKSLVIVTVGKQHVTEMMKNLKRLDFKNVCYTEYSTLKLLERIKE